MSNNYEEEVKKMVAEIAEIPVAKLKPDADFFKDLGMDSLKAIEIVAAFEKKYKIIIPENEIPDISTVRHIVAYLNAKK
ncbi:MAG: acyl carrier protein [Nitrospirae bacterium]|nr:acyl carrier protein [Nitrospirota bacterium]